MYRKNMITIFALALLAFSTACSGLQLPWNSQNADSAEQAGIDPAEMTVENRLAVGILILEGTDLAVSPEQAREQLPLWKAVRSLGSSDTVSPAELQALYDQVRESLSAGQIQQIEEMDLSRESLAALMEDLGLEMGFAMGGPGGFSGTPQAGGSDGPQRGGDFPGGGAGGGMGGGMPGGGPGGGFSGPPSDMGGFPMPGGTQGTPVPGAAGGRRGMGMNFLFLNPLIELLTVRAEG
jgi:hypothetical protein